MLSHLADSETIHHYRIGVAKLITTGDHFINYGRRSSYGEGTHTRATRDSYAVDALAFPAIGRREIVLYRD